MSLADYARANNLGVQTLQQWRSTLKMPQQPTQHLPEHFSQVVTVAGACALSIEFNSARLQFDRLPDVQWLSTFIRSHNDDS